METDKVSIITPTFNSSEYISKTINSIISQSYKYWELLITDDFSTDNTAEIIKKYTLKDKRIKLLRLKKNSGAGVARNNSIRHAKGNFIAFCDSDDQWIPSKLEKQIAFLKQNNLSFTYSAYDVINENGQYLRTIIPPKIINYETILRNNYIGCSTAIYNAKKLGKLYMPVIRKRQDWVLWIKIFKVVGKTIGMSESLVLYRVSKDSISSNKISLIKYNFNVFKNELKFGIFKSFYMMLKFIYYYFKKKIINNYENYRFKKRKRI